MRAYLQLVSSPVARKRYTSPTRETVRPCWGIRIIGFIRLVSSLFCGQCLHELRRPPRAVGDLLGHILVDQPAPDGVAVVCRKAVACPNARSRRWPPSFTR